MRSFVEICEVPEIVLQFIFSQRQAINISRPQKEDKRY